MRYFLAVSFFFCVTNLKAQISTQVITESAADSIMQYLAGKELKGRASFTEEGFKATQYIANHFAKNGLKFFPGDTSFISPLAVNIKGVEMGKKNRHQNTIYNVVGVLEGKSKWNEVIIFSAHYDHVGVYNGEAYLGANDNASGTTALLLLADYFAKKEDNERTLMFCAFGGEELGLVGSGYFANLINPSAVKAMVNIEMIGKSTIGKSAFFITGSYKSNLASLLKNHLPTGMRLRNEPNAARMLFERSDNYPFALKGIPAHSIMSSDDSDPCYHKPCDDLKGISKSNMVNIIRAIAIAAQPIIEGTQTPTLIKN